MSKFKKSWKGKQRKINRYWHYYIFLSCFGISIYDQASHDSYTNYQDKLPFETIFVTSAVTGIILAIITWLVLTLYDCHKKAREDGSATTLDLFKKELFSKRAIIDLAIIIIVLILASVLGLILLSLLVFYIFILKGKINWRK